MNCIVPHIPLLLASLAIAAHAQSAESQRGRLARAIKIIPVPHLVSPQSSLTPLPFGSMLGGGGASGQEQGSERCSLLTGERGRAEDPQPPVVADLPELLRNLTPLTWSDGGCRVDLVGDALLVTGSPDQMHIVEQSLQKLMACLGEPVRLQAATFTVAQGADVPTVAASYAEMRSRLAQLGAQTTWEGAASAMPGRSVEIGGLTTRTYVADSEVEIAQSSTMANPVVCPLHTGAALHVQAHALCGNGDLVIMAQFAHGELLGPMREVSLGHDAVLPRLQSPNVAVATGSFSGRVRNGGALALVADGLWGGRRVGIVVAAERPPVSAELERELGVFPLSTFLAPALRARFFQASSDAPSVVWTVPLVPGDEPAHRLDPGDDTAWHALCQHALGDEQCDVTIIDQRAVVRGSAAAKSTVARLIELMQEQFCKTVEVECRLEEIAAKPAGLAQRMRFPALLGRNHAFTYGAETTAVWDQDVEVAQKSGIADPKVVRHFSGTVCSVQAYALGAQDLAVNALIRVTDTVPGGVFELGNKKGIPIDQPTIARARFAHDGRITGQDGIDFGEGPTLRLPDRMMRTRQTLSLKAR